MNDLNQLQSEYYDFVKESYSKLKELQMEVFVTPSTGLSKPGLTVELLNDVAKQVGLLRKTVHERKEKLVELRLTEVNSLVDQLAKLVPTKDTTKKKPVDLKWVTELKTLAKTSPDKEYFESTFEYESKTFLQFLVNQTARLKSYEEKSLREKSKHAEFLWCENYALQTMKLEKDLLERLSKDTLVDLVHSHLKSVFSKEHNLTGEKCYCESHYEVRHYHFAETLWNGTEVEVFESSETY